MANDPLREAIEEGLRRINTYGGWDAGSVLASECADAVEAAVRPLLQENDRWAEETVEKAMIAMREAEAQRDAVERNALSPQEWAIVADACKWLGMKLTKLNTPERLKRVYDLEARAEAALRGKP